MKKKVPEERCPICNCVYSKKRRKTKHHIFPKWWYNEGLKVYACSKCHQSEFHIIYKMEYENPWNESTCVQNWVKFCKSKGKNAYEIYPELRTLQPLY